MSLTNHEKRHLKSLAQRLDPILQVGKAGVTDAFLAGVALALESHELIKIKFAAFKEQRHELAAEIAARTQSELVWIVGHVAVFYRVHSDPVRPHILPAG